MPHYYLFKLKKNDVVFEFSSQDPKIMYSQFNKWADELINSGTKKKINIAKTVEIPKIQQSFTNDKKSEPIIIEKIKVVSQAEYEAMQKKEAQEQADSEYCPIINDYPEEFETSETDQVKQSVKLASLNLDDIDKSSRNEAALPLPEKEVKEENYDYITFDKIDKSIDESEAKNSNSKILKNDPIKETESTSAKSKFKLYEAPEVKEYKAFEFNSHNGEIKEEEIITEEIIEHSVIKEKFNPSNSSPADNSQDQFFKILQKKFSSITDETTQSQVEEIEVKAEIKVEKNKNTPISESPMQEIKRYASHDRTNNINPAIVPGKALDLKDLDNLIQLKKPNNMFDYLLIAAYYLKESEYRDRYSLKQINAKVFPYTKKPIDHSIIQKAVARNYVEVVPDYTGMAEVTEYVITEDGENYLLNEL